MGNNTFEQLLSEEASNDASFDPETEAAVTGNEATLEEVVGGSATESDEPKKEPGYVQKRIDKALAKQRQELDAEFDRKLQAALAPFRDEKLNMEADRLVSSGVIKDKETALEYLKLKDGYSGNTEEKPRDENGQFVSKEDAEVKRKANELFNEAKTIKKSTGVDVMEYYKSDPDIQYKILNGEWDFSDVYNYVKEKEKHNSPTVVRSSNGVDIGKINIAKMSAKDMQKMNEYLEKGGRIDMRR